MAELLLLTRIKTDFQSLPPLPVDAERSIVRLSQLPNRVGKYITGTGRIGNNGLEIVINDLDELAQEE